jgi:hypothetical protein
MDGQQLFAMVQRIIQASRPYQDAQDGSYEASLYYHSCEEVERLNQASDSLELKEDVSN